VEKKLGGQGNTFNRELGTGQNGHKMFVQKDQGGGNHPTPWTRQRGPRGNGKNIGGGKGHEKNQIKVAKSQFSRSQKGPLPARALLFPLKKMVLVGKRRGMGGVKKGTGLETGGKNRLQ